MKFRTVFAVITAAYAVTLYAANSVAGSNDFMTVGDGKKDKCTRYQVMDKAHYQAMMYHYHQRMIEAHREAGINPYSDQSAVRGAVGIENSAEAPTLRF